MKWIVTWVVVKMIPIVCPDPYFACDEFGRCLDTVNTALECQEIVKKDMSRIFASEVEVKEFVRRAKQIQCLKVGSPVTVIEWTKIGCLDDITIELVK